RPGDCPSASVVRGRDESVRSFLVWLEDRLDDPLGRELVADERLHLHARKAAPHLVNHRLESTGLTRFHHPLEAHLIDAREQTEAVAIFGKAHREHGRALRHALHEDDTGHDRIPREVARLVPLLSGEVMFGDRAYAWLEFGDAIDEEEWIAMRNERFDLALVQLDHSASLIIVDLGGRDRVAGQERAQLAFSKPRALVL